MYKFFFSSIIISIVLIVDSNAYLRSSYFLTSRSADGKECFVSDKKGQCMFTFECMQHKGQPIGICMERYFVGSCCYFESNGEELLLQTNTDNDQMTDINNSISQTNSLKLKKIEKNNERLIESNSTTFVTESSIVSQQENKIIHSSTELSTLNLELTLTHQTLFNTNLNELNESSNFINSTNLQKKINYSEQIKPIHLIESSNALSSNSNSSINYSPDTSTTNNSANLMSGFASISALISELSKYHTESPADLHSSSTSITENQNRLINKNSTTNKLTARPNFETTVEQTTVTITTDRPSWAIEKFFKNQECGIQPKKRPKARVVGGSNAEPGRWPWMVLIKESSWFGYYIKSRCGGVLIHPQFVLTAAHCSNRTS